jgi:hypothetical protein
MCKSIETSLSTFVFSLTCLAASVTLCKTKEVYFASIFVFTFSLMQLIDAGLWWSISHKNRLLNTIISRYVTPVVLVTQPLVSYFGVKYLFGWSNQYYEFGLAMFVTVMLVTWIFKYCNNANAYTLPHSDGYLHWCGVEISSLMRVLFLLFGLSPIVIGMPSNHVIVKWLIALPIIATFFMNFMHSTFGSRWCWSSNITSALLLAYSTMHVCRKAKRV